MNGSFLYRLNTQAVGWIGFVVCILGPAVLLFTNSDFVKGFLAHDPASYIQLVVALATGVAAFLGLVGRTPAVKDDPGAKLLNPTPVPPKA